MPTPSFQVPGYLNWIPVWAFGLAVVVVALALALALHALLVRALRRGLDRRDKFTRSLIIRTRAPSRFALLVLALSWAVRVAPLSDGLARGLQHGLLIAFIVLVGWGLMTALDIGTALYLRRQRLDVPDNLHARKLLTQTRILRRSLNVLVLVVTAAMALMTIPGVKQLGVSLLAAGGAAGIIVGLALQPVLSNIMAGIQLAFTQPIRIDDAVVVGGEFGHVEEIKSTFVVVRLRDLRRLIVPLKYFLEQPFQNWTLESSDLRAEVIFQVDQRTPVDRLRAEIEAAAQASEHWAGGELQVQVHDITDKTQHIRVRAAARNATAATALRAALREHVIGWLQRELPHLLPRAGVEPPAARTPAPSRPSPDSAGTPASAAPHPARPN